MKNKLNINTDADSKMKIKLELSGRGGEILVCSLSDDDAEKLKNESMKSDDNFYEIWEKVFNEDCFSDINERFGSFHGNSINSWAGGQELKDFEVKIFEEKKLLETLEYKSIQELIFFDTDNDQEVKDIIESYKKSNKENYYFSGMNLPENEFCVIALRNERGDFGCVEIETDKFEIEKLKIIMRDLENFTGVDMYEVIGIIYNNRFYEINSDTNDTYVKGEDFFVIKDYKFIFDGEEWNW